MIRNYRDSTPTPCILACPHCGGTHRGVSEHAGYVDARWRAERIIEECGKKKKESENADRD